MGRKYSVLKNTQIASFFSRFAAQYKKRTDGNKDTKEVSDEESVNKINDPILNLTPENITQHSGIE